MTDTERRPTQQGAKRCLEFMREMKRIGWLSSTMPQLVDLWWKHRDDDGNLLEQQPKSETESNG